VKVRNLPGSGKDIANGKGVFLFVLLANQDKRAQKYPRTGMCEGMGLQFICADMASLGNFMMAFR